MEKRPTVSDVARIAQVGASTVSRYLRGGSISKKAAARVAAAVTQLSYYPHETARALRIGRTRTIGVVIPQVANMFYARAVQLLEEEASKRGCAVILLTHQETLEQQALQLSTMQRYRVDGVILAPAAGSTDEEIRAALPYTPVVMLDRRVSKTLDWVGLRNREAAQTATKHLQNHGRKKIACVVSRPEITSFTQRLEGYNEATISAGLEALVISAPDHDELRASIMGHLKGNKRPDALLSFSNRATQTILLAYGETALPQKEWPALIGFDDFELAACIDPPLSVVRQPVEDMVRYAMNILFERIEGNKELKTQNISLSGQMIYRRSCGCK